MSVPPQAESATAPALTSGPATTSDNPAAPAQTDATNSQPPENVEPKISGAELKKKRQAEKQAKRAQAKAAGGPPNVQKGPPPKEGQKQQQQQKGSKQPQAPKDEHTKPLPVRRRPSQPHVPVLKDSKKEPKKEPKQVGLFFGHLYNQPRTHSMVGATKEVHPAVLALGLQYSSYVICGSTARMVSMLLAFKAVIESYQTPVGTSLARHLTSHHLSPQIDYLRSCRPLSISMGNAIRWLKDVIIKIDPQTPEAEAKRDLLSEIDLFIRERVIAADELISSAAFKKVEPGDVILTFASSAIVEQSLTRAHAKGVPFTVIVIDDKPLFEGKRLAKSLAQKGIKTKYRPYSAAAHAIKEANKVFLGAHAMMSNGRLYSRVGTAGISMLAYSNSLPVIVLCESVKFTERVALDSIVGNELAPPEELLSDSERLALTSLKPGLPRSINAKDEGETPAKPGDVVSWFQDSQHLQLLQILYDVTPAEYITMVITEYGSLPPSSVPVVHRLSTDVR